MAKPKTPLLSLGARGTIGGALTYQKRGRGTIAREKPIPRDPYSLAQAYQRWDYRDYAYLWTLLSNSEKQVYRTAASRYHITGYSLWMRQRLKDLDGMLGRWHLDYRSGTIQPDTSKQDNNGTVIGASPTPGAIDGALYFDGLNDYVDVGQDSSLRLIGDQCSLEFSIYPTAPMANNGIYAYGAGSINAGIQLAMAASKVRFRTWADLESITILEDVAALLDQWTHYVANYDGTKMELYKNAVLQTTTPAQTGDLTSLVDPYWIGGYFSTSYLFEGRIDEVVLRNFPLPLELIEKHSERRYPA